MVYTSAFFSLILFLARKVLKLESAGGALRAVWPHGEVELAVERLVEALQVVAAAPVRVVFLVLRKRYESLRLVN